MTEEEKDKAVKKLKNNADLIRYVHCEDAGFVADFQKFGKVRVKIPESIQNKVLNIIYEEYQKEIGELEKKECAEEAPEGAVIFTWEEATKRYRGKL